MRSPLLIAVLLSAFLGRLTEAAPKAKPPRHTPAEAVNGFYQYHLSHDDGFSEKSLKAREKWLTPELVALLRYELNRDTPKDEPPYIEGDPFTDSQEGPGSFHVAGHHQKGTHAIVDVDFIWKDHGRVVTRNTHPISLERRHGVWLISDVRSDRGSLVHELRDLKAKDHASRSTRGKVPHRP